MSCNIFTRAAFGTFRFCKKHSTVILAVAACGGVVATGVTAVKAYRKIEDDLYSTGTDLTREEELRIIVKHAAVPACIGLATIGCIAGETIIDIRKEKSLTATIALVQGGFQRYRDGLIELHGKEADDEVMHFISARGDSYDYHCTADCGPDKKVWWYEPISGQKILAYERQIIDGEYHFNRNFTMRGVADLNEFLEFVGMNQIDGLENLGWTTSDGYYWVDVSHHEMGVEEDGIPIMRFDFVFCPEDDYMREWL